MLIWSPTVVSQRLSKSDKRGWLTGWPPQSFANPIWHSAHLYLHRSAIMPLCFHLLYFLQMVGLLHAMAFMVLLRIGWVIWNNKPLPLPLVRCEVKEVRAIKINCKLYWKRSKTMQSTIQSSMAKRCFVYLEKYLTIFNLLSWVWNSCEAIRWTIFLIITERNNAIAHILCGVPTPMHI